MQKKLSISLVASVLLATTNLFSAQDLETITVTSATKSTQSIKDVTSNVEVITSEEIQEKHFTTVSEALNTLAGISIISNGGIGGSSTLSLRGTSNNRTLILIDGVKFKDHSSISGTDISTLMINDIERIEVIKGAQSGIWGADAAAGVINIITKSAKDGLHANANIEAGTYNTSKYNTQVSYKNKDFDLKLDALKLTSDSFSTKANYGDDLDSLEDDRYENTTLNLKGNYYINDDAKIGFSITDIDSLKEYDSSSANDTTMKNDSQSKIYNLNYEQGYKNHKFLLKTDRSDIKRDQIGTTWGVKLTDSTSENLELMDNITYNEKDFVLLGLGLSKDEIDYTKADNTKNNASSDSKYVYVTNNNNFNKLILTQSLRHDNFDNFDNKTTGKIGAKYNVNDNLSFSSNLGTSYSVPLLIQNVNPWGDTNFDIEAEKSKTFDIGFDYDDFKVTYFYHKVRDLIDWYDPTPTNYYNNDAIYTNLDGTSTFEGVEISYKRELISDLLTSLNYTYLEAKDSDKEDLARRAKNSFKFGIDYYGINKFHFNVNGEYVGNRKEDAYGVGTVQTGNYTVWNSVVNYEINKTFSTYLKVDNLFDKYYQTIYGYATAERSAYVGLKATF
jgi:vitamin B12 transporter